MKILKKFNLFNKSSKTYPDFLEHKGSGLQVSLKQSPRATRIRLALQASHFELRFPPGLTVQTLEKTLNSSVFDTFIEKNSCNLQEPILAETQWPWMPHKVIWKLNSHYKSLECGIRKQQLFVRYPDSKSILDNQKKILSAVLRLMKKLAEESLPSRLQELAEIHQIPFASCTIRSQKSRWGSCTADRISLHANLITLPDHLKDYVLLHELCHIEVKNHSAKFWKRLEQICPGAQKLDRELSGFSLLHT